MARSPSALIGSTVRFGSLADICTANGMSAFLPIADMCGAPADVCFVPIADIAT